MFAEKLGDELRHITKKLRQAYRGYLQLREVNVISRHFSNYFKPVVGKNEELIRASATIRHKVFCEELQLFDKNEEKIELDHYDSFSQYCLIQHIKSNAYAGTVRMIAPESEEQVLPICKIAGPYITNQDLHPRNFNPNEVFEISRISIPPEFRRREQDKFKGAAQGGVDTDVYSEIEMRCFPIIAVGMYMACAAFGKIHNRNHAFFMVEPWLAKSMRHIGIHLTRIGDSFEYVGTRAPYYIYYDTFMEHLKPAFKEMVFDFEKLLKEQQNK